MKIWKHRLSPASGRPSDTIHHSERQQRPSRKLHSLLPPFLLRQLLHLTPWTPLRLTRLEALSAASSYLAQFDLTAGDFLFAAEDRDLGLTA